MSIARLLLLVHVSNQCLPDLMEMVYGSYPSDAILHHQLLLASSIRGVLPKVERSAQTCII